MRRRVVITGIGLASPIGNDLDALAAALREGRHGVAARADWASIGQLQTRLAAEVRDLDLGAYPRKKARTMGRVGLLALYATERALADAGLAPGEVTSGRTGLAYGSTHGSSSALEAFCRQLFATGSLQGLAGSTYLKFMSHTCAANLAQCFGLRGRVISTCAACVSASVAIGTGYELVRDGVQDVMICGGAEEMHFVHAGVFDIMFATSCRYNDRPDLSPRPFDADRDGLVVGEGAGALVLEPYDRAVARGARIHAEVIGFGNNCDGTHVTSPSSVGMADVMRLALEDARLPPAAVGYINAHATATDVGDIAESEATRRVFGEGVPVSSTKGHTGHTLGACGAIEAAVCVLALRDGRLPPTRNLDRVDPRCAPLDYITRAPREAPVEVAMSNNFAFGGINTSLIFRRAP